MSKPRPKTLSEQLREQIDGCGMTRYRLAHETGISESLLSLFMAGKRGLSIDTLDTLGEHLGLELITHTRATKPHTPRAGARKGRNP